MHGVDPRLGRQVLERDPQRRRPRVRHRRDVGWRQAAPERLDDDVRQQRRCRVFGNACDRMPATDCVVASTSMPG